MPNKPVITKNQDFWAANFSAMSCPCEILICTESKNTALKVADIAFNEALRIEHKFSRYLNNNIIFKINNSNGHTIEVDEETANILDFAKLCFELSEGKFDITSGILRQIWKFDGSDNIPAQKDINAIRLKIGWHQIQWDNPYITLKPGMEIDLGGIGKEYAVDQAAKLIQSVINTGVLINFGGDIFALKHLDSKQPWRIGVDDPGNTGRAALGEIKLYHGGLATSGDSRRFLLKDGIRYSHILDPTTGKPVPDAPHSVTVIANTCLEAGMLSTIAMLQGTQAKDFLDIQDTKYWVV
jgi:FAD:protein FMN transferase